MPQSNDPSHVKALAEDSYLDVIVETLDGVDDIARGQVLRQLFHTIAQIEITETQSLKYWDLILARRRELTGNSGRKVSVKTALVDVLSAANLLRVPILMEYEDLKKLKINAATDGLTGLYNRRLFDEYCDKELNRAKRYGQNLAIVILDLHKLKDVNDRYGHLVGDHALQTAAITLSKSLRASDSAFRIGGDEFALLLPQTDMDQAVTLCRRLRVQYEGEVKPMKLELGVTLDFGVAVHPQDGDQKSQLMGLADKKLYELKNSGRTSRRSTPTTTPSIREAAARPSSAPNPAAPTTPAVTPAKTAPLSGPDQRKWERVALGGTKAHAVLTDLGQKSAKVVDLSYGGVALLLQTTDDVPNQFNAVLHVPILPPVRVVLRKTYTFGAESNLVRVGCAFVS